MSKDDRDDVLQMSRLGLAIQKVRRPYELSL